jgi:hypothetical protein
MINNAPIYEIEEEREEVEEDINTNRDLVFERLNTEYGEEDEEFDYRIIADELVRHLKNGLSFLCMFILLLVGIVYKLDLDLALIPLFILDFSEVLVNIFNLKTLADDTYVLNKASVKSLINAIGNIFFYILLIVYSYTANFYFSLTCLPLIVASVSNFVINSRPSTQCQLFSKIVRSI